MTPVETSRTCCVCKKLFCCIQCRERHEKIKHSDEQLKCPFCTSQKLPLQSLEDKLLLCHIVITHLPLYCKLCGEIFKEGKDLESLGTCIWWKSQHRYSLASDYKSILGTPPLTSNGNESSLNNTCNFGSLTSPPELYRKTSTPMVDGLKNLEFKTPIVPNFSLKTPKTNSLNNQTESGFQDSTASNYVSFPPSISHKETPFRSMSLNLGSKDDLPRSNSRTLATTQEREKHSSDTRLTDHHSGTEDMELTNVEGEVLPDSQSLDIQEKRSDSLKKVRFSDQYEAHGEPSTANFCNMTENEEYFEARDTMPELKKTVSKLQAQSYEENDQDMDKENCDPNKVRANVNLPLSSSKVVMMMVVENNTNVSTPNLINRGLKRLQSITTETNLSNIHHIYRRCNCLVKIVDSDCIVSCQTCHFASHHAIGCERKDSTSSNSSSSSSNSSRGILSAVTNAMKSMMKSFSDTAENIDTREVIPRDDAPKPSTSSAFNPMSTFVSSLLRRPGKRTRENIESPPSSPRQMDLVVSPRSPLAKRHRGWHGIKGREPIARMRNHRLTSPRGVSSETQIFHQGSLSVGDTILPLPSRAHQSTQTDEN